MGYQGVWMPGNDGRRVGSWGVVMSGFLVTGDLWLRGGWVTRVLVTMFLGIQVLGKTSDYWVSPPVTRALLHGDFWLDFGAKKPPGKDFSQRQRLENTVKNSPPRPQKPKNSHLSLRRNKQPQKPPQKPLKMDNFSAPPIVAAEILKPLI